MDEVPDKCAICGEEIDWERQEAAEMWGPQWEEDRESIICHAQCGLDTDPELGYFIMMRGACRELAMACGFWKAGSWRGRIQEALGCACGSCVAHTRPSPWNHTPSSGR